MSLANPSTSWPPSRPSLKRLHTRRPRSSTQLLCGKNHWTVLHYAVAAGDVRVVNQLINSGVCLSDLNAPDVKGFTPLFWAVKKGQQNVAAVLIASGANPNVSDYTGKTVLMEAIERRDIDMVQFLISHGAMINAKNSSGETALHIAAGAGCERLCMLLVNNGAFLEAADACGDTPLHFAVRSGCAKTTQSLLAVGANPNNTNEDGESPIELAECLNSNVIHLPVSHLASHFGSLNLATPNFNSHGNSL